jgi:hypothetical protein
MLIGNSTHLPIVKINTKENTHIFLYAFPFISFTCPRSSDEISCDSYALCPSVIKGLVTILKLCPSISPCHTYGFLYLQLKCTTEKLLLSNCSFSDYTSTHSGMDGSSATFLERVMWSRSSSQKHLPHIAWNRNLSNVFIWFYTYKCIIINLLVTYHLEKLLIRSEVQ